MTVNARDLKNNDTTDAGFDLLTDATTIGAVTGDAGITRILFGSAGVDGGFAPGDATNGIDVDVTRLPALVAGSAIIGAVTQSGTWNVTNVSGTVSLPTGASTLAEQQTQTTALQLIDDVVHSGDAALSKYAVIGAVLDDTATVAVTENQASALRMSTRRALLIEGVASGTAVTVSGSGTFTVDTELPAAAALADGAANPTSPAVGSFLMVWNATTWDRAPGSTADGQLVNLGTNNDVTVTSGTITTVTTVTTVSTVTSVSSVAAVIPGTGATNLGKAEDAAHTSGDTGVMGLAVRTDTPINRSGTDGDYEPLQMASGRLWTSATIDAALPAGTNAIGKLAANSGIDIGDTDVTSVIPGTGATNLGKAEDAAHTSADVGVMVLGVRTDTQAALAGTTGDYIPLQMDSLGGLYVTDRPLTAGGLLISRDLDADETETEAKATAGQVFGYYFANTHATSWRYLKFYNATAATVVVGTTTPVMTLGLPAASAGHVEFSKGIEFATAICYAVTTGVADNDTGAPGANEVVLNVFYK